MNALASTALLTALVAVVIALTVHVMGSGASGAYKYGHDFHSTDTASQCTAEANGLFTQNQIGFDEIDAFIHGCQDSIEGK